MPGCLADRVAGSEPRARLRTTAFAVVRRQIARVRRRRNLATALRLACLAAAGALTALALSALAALRLRPLGFGIAVVVLALALAMLLLWSGRAARRGWLGRAAAPAWIDRHVGLRGRVETLSQLDGQPRAFLPLLLAQTLESLPAWRPGDVIPRLLPRLPLAALAAAATAMLAIVVLAPRLRPAPRVVVGDRRVDWVAARDAAGDTPERLLVTPGSEHVPEQAAGATAAGEPGDPGSLDGLSASLQDWLTDRLGVEDWEHGDAPPDLPPGGVRRTRAADARQSRFGDTAAPGDTKTSEEATSDEATDVDARPTTADATSDTEARIPGDGGAGAGTGTDPELFGTPRDDGTAVRDRFELAIAARVRTQPGTPRDPWSTAPTAEPDRRPTLAAGQRPETPAHRMPVPAAYETLVRRAFTHDVRPNAP